MERFRAANPEYLSIPMTYAGRLDPIAEGVLVVLAGEEVHKKVDYLGLDKEYVARLLLGFSSDTYDVLGIGDGGSGPVPPRSEIEKTLTLQIGTRDEPYPPYSSKTVRGKPLFLWAREGALDAVEIPTHQIKVYDAVLEDLSLVGSSELYSEIESTVVKVAGDFRQEEILKKWRSLLDENKKYAVLTVRYRVSSGTYIRSLAHALGATHGMGAVLLSLIRTRVGEYSLADHT